MKILLYEHACGGGFTEPVQSTVLAEGYGMLTTLASDLKKAGHQVTVLMDTHISKLNPPINADFTVPVFFPKEPEKFLAKLATLNDAVYVVAPETGQILKSLTETIEKTGSCLLNCASDSIGKSSNKATLHDCLKQLGLPTPETITFNTKDEMAKIKHATESKLHYPLVLKPLDGVSCSGLCIVKNAKQLEEAVDKIKSETTTFIAQEFIRGEDASVSLLCTGSKALPISLNRQNVTIAAPDSNSSYDGGCVPFDHPLKEKAFEIAQKIAVYFGLKGYVGVDFVLTHDSVFAVDVNPRLTTSYVGLSKIACFNVAQAIIDAVLKKQLPKKPVLNGYACFSKIQTPKPTITALQKIFALPEVISPPFPASEPKTHALICGCADSLADSVFSVQEAKKHLLRIIS